MKKLLSLIALCLIPALARADIAVTTGSGKTVATTTDASREFQNVVVSTTQVVVEGGVLSPVGYNTTTSSYMPVAIKGGSIANTSFAISTGGVTAAQGGTWTVQPGNTPNTTPWVVQVATGGVSVKFDGTQTVNVATGGVTAAQGGAWTVNVATGGVSAAQVGTWTMQPGNTPNTTAWLTQITTGGVTAAQGGTWAVSVNNLTGQTTAYIVNVTTSPAMVLVSSNTTMPASTADVGQAQAMGDAYGRMVMMSGVTTAIRLSTSPAAISNTSSIVLVSSPASTLFTHICGCVIGNTSTTNTYVTFYPSGAPTTSGFKYMMAPAGNFPTGYPLDCSNPFLNTTAGGVQVTVNAAASVSSLYISCDYYQNTTP